MFNNEELPKSYVKLLRAAYEIQQMEGIESVCAENIALSSNRTQSSVETDMDVLNRMGFVTKNQFGSGPIYYGLKENAIDILESDSKK